MPTPSDRRSRPCPGVAAGARSGDGDGMGAVQRLRPVEYGVVLDDDECWHLTRWANRASTTAAPSPQSTRGDGSRSGRAWMSRPPSSLKDNAGRRLKPSGGLNASTFALDPGLHPCPPPPLTASTIATFHTAHGTARRVEANVDMRVVDMGSFRSVSSPPIAARACAAVPVPA